MDTTIARKKEVKKEKIRHNRNFGLSRGERVFGGINYAILTLLAIITLFPFYIVIIKSLAPPVDFYANDIIWWPSKMTFSYYGFVLGSASEFMQALRNSLFFVTVGTFVNILSTFVAAFVLAQKKLPFRNQITFLMTFTMFFSGGMIPSFILMRNLHLTNSMLGIVISGMVGTMYVLYLRNFIMTIPVELTESAYVDGCPEYKILFKIIFPLSLPALATFTLFYAVGQWNQFTAPVLYITDSTKYPLQVYVNRLLSALTMTGDPTELAKLYADGYKAPEEGLKAAAIVCSTIPIVLVYPFLQKYFVKGMMMGSLKG